MNSDASAKGALRAALGNPDFVRIWMVGACGGTMRWLEVLAVSIYTLSLTGSALDVALMYFARTGPTLLCAPIAGALAERVPRRVLLGAGFSIAALTSMVLAVLAHTGHLTLWQVAVGAVISGIFWSLEHTVRRTIARDVVDPLSIGNAISLDSSTQNATRMLGPLAGGTLYAMVGMPGAYSIGALFYATAVVLIVLMRQSLPPVRIGAESLLAGLVSVLRYIATERTVAGVLAITVCLNFFGSPYVAMVAVIGRDVLGLDAQGIGMLMATEGGGAMLGAMALAVSVNRRHYARIFTFGAIGFVGGICAFANATSPAGAAAALAFCGLGLGGFAAMQSTILLTECRADMRARVMGILAVTIGAGPIGTLLLGWATEYLGASSAVSVSSALGLAAFALVIYLWPELVRAHGR